MGIVLASSACAFQDDEDWGTGELDLGYSCVEIPIEEVGDAGNTEASAFESRCDKVPELDWLAQVASRYGSHARRSEACLVGALLELDLCPGLSTDPQAGTKANAGCAGDATSVVPRLDACGISPRQLTELLASRPGSLFAPADLGLVCGVELPPANARLDTQFPIGLRAHTLPARLRVCNGECAARTQCSDRAPLRVCDDRPGLRQFELLSARHCSHALEASPRSGTCGIGGRCLGACRAAAGVPATCSECGQFDATRTILSSASCEPLASEGVANCAGECAGICEGSCLYETGGPLSGGAECFGVQTDLPGHPACGAMGQPVCAPPAGAVEDCTGVCLGEVTAPDDLPEARLRVLNAAWSLEYGCHDDPGALVEPSHAQLLRRSAVRAAADEVVRDGLETLSSVGWRAVASLVYDLEPFTEAQLAALRSEGLHLVDLDLRQALADFERNFDYYVALGLVREVSLDVTD